MIEIQTKRERERAKDRKGKNVKGPMAYGLLKAKKRPTHFAGDEARKIWNQPREVAFLLLFLKKTRLNRPKEKSRVTLIGQGLVRKYNI